jgi:hypothetical protein
MKLGNAIECLQRLVDEKNSTLILRGKSIYDVALYEIRCSLPQPEEDLKQMHSSGNLIEPIREISSVNGSSVSQLRVYNKLNEIIRKSNCAFNVINNL